MNLTDYFKMFERFRWVHIMVSFLVLFPHLFVCCEPLYWSGIQLPLKVPQSSHNLISALVHFQFPSAGVESFCHVTKRCTRLDENINAPPPGCLLFYRTSAQTDSPISDWLCCSSPLIVPPAALPSSVCNKEIHSEWNTATTKTLIPIAIYSLFHEEIENLFFFFFFFINFMDYLLIMH